MNNETFKAALSIIELALPDVRSEHKRRTIETFLSKYFF